MSVTSKSSRVLLFILALVCLVGRVPAQNVSPDGEADPIKLFQAGQDAHERGDLNQAIDLYQAAVKLRPEFPEAELQIGTALMQLGKPSEAEVAIKRAAELRPTWALPWALLGSLYLRAGKTEDAISALSKSLELEPSNSVTIKELASLEIPGSASKENLKQLLASLQSTTSGAEASPDAWTARANIETALGDSQAAVKSLDKAIASGKSGSLPLVRRAVLHQKAGDLVAAIKDAEAARAMDPGALSSALLLADLLAQSERPVEAIAILDSLPDAVKQRPEVSGLKNSLLANSAEGPEARAALEKLLEKDPKNVTVLARLGSLYRIENPQRSIEYYQRAVTLAPTNVTYATGYAAALIQARRFADAAQVLRRVTDAAPDNFVAHANLATALYEMGDFRAALGEYDWLLKAKPDLTVALFFIATARDKLGELPEALEAYEAFLGKADPAKNQLEIEKVNLRLPSLRNQIKRGEGVKRKEKH